MTTTAEMPSVFEKSIVIPHATLLKMECREVDVPAVFDGEMRRVVLRLHGPDTYDDHYFFSGTSIDEPLGIINSGAAITVPRLWAGTITNADIMRMMLVLYIDIDSAPAWFVSSGWEGKLDTNRLGMRCYPVVYTNSLPGPGQVGDLILADFRHYLIGYNADDPLEVDGLPWMPYPVEKDGHRESPFVLLGGPSQ